MQVYLANPRGFCAGVDRAIGIVERALEMFGAPIFVRHEVVHNKFVVDGLRRKGAIFVDELRDVPDGATVIFSAHGVSKAVWREAQERELRVFDATCPLVTKVHIEVAKHAEEGREVILIGHEGHPEVEGTMGQYERHNAGGGVYLVEDVADVETLALRNPDSAMFVTQTTLSVDDTKEIIAALQRKFPGVRGPRKDDICYATQNRQDAVKTLAAESQVVLVVGSKNSSNSNRLREIAEKEGARAYLIDNAAQIRPEWIEGADSVGVTAGASAPEVLVKDVLRLLEEKGATVQELRGREENVVFSLPKELRKA